MKIGDYVRTNYGSIVKIEAMDEEVTLSDKGYIDKENVIKSSPNIIDLIEFGDYVNGSRVVDICEQCVWVEDRKYDVYTDSAVCIRYNNEDIKSIVTKEQFESMKYKVVE